MLAHRSSTNDDSRAIRVLVVPIGENSLFDLHYQTISQLRDVNLDGLSKPSDWRMSNTAGFKNFTWHKGNLLFDYLRYDRVPNGPGDLDDFQSSRRVLMIMGLINYPELGPDPMNKIHQELEYFTRRHPNVVLRRLFLFNYGFSHAHCDPHIELLLPALRDPSLMIVFPPDLSCDDGSSSMVNVHLDVNIENAAIKIIQSFGNQMQSCEKAHAKNELPAKADHIPLCTFYDEIEERAAADKRDNNGTGDDRQRSISSSSGVARGYKKRPTGRLCKWMGDLSLQVCSPVDAVGHFVSSIAECRASNDRMWLAGALEGFAGAILLLIQYGYDLEAIPVLAKEMRAIAYPTLSISDKGKQLSTIVRALILAEERAAEALSIYSDSVVFCALEVECALRISKLHELFATAAIFKDEVWPGAKPRALAYVLRAASVPGLNTQQQIECTIEGALICKRLKLQRKYAFWLYIAAITSAEDGNMSMAHALLRSAAKQYGINNVSDSLVDNGSSDADAVSSNSGVHSWSNLRALLLEQCALTAHKSGDSRAAARYLAALLRLQARDSAGLLVSVMNFINACTADKSNNSSLDEIFKLHTAMQDEHNTSFEEGQYNSISHPNSAAYSLQQSRSSSTGGSSTPQSEHPQTPSSTTINSTDNAMSSKSNGFFAISGVLGGGVGGVFGSGASQAAIEVGKSTGRESMLYAMLGELLGEKHEQGNVGRTKMDEANVDLYERHMAKHFPYSYSIQYRVEILSGGNEIDRSARSHSSSSGSGYNSDDWDIISPGERQVSLPPNAISLSLPPDHKSVSEAATHEVSSAPLNGQLADDFVEIAATALGRQCSYISPKQQELALSLLDALKVDLVPAYQLCMPELLYCLQPLPLIDGVRPEVLHPTPFCQALNAANTIIPVEDKYSKPAGLYYDPTLAKKGKMEFDANASLVWSAECVCSVVAVLFNPFSVPLHFSSVELVLSGAAYSVHSQELTLPPRCQRFEARFAVIPLEPGVLKLEALVLRMGSLVQKLPVGATGYALHVRDEDQESARARYSESSSARDDLENNDSSPMPPSALRKHYSHHFVTVGRVEAPCPGIANTSIKVTTAGPTIQAALDAGDDSSGKDEWSNSFDSTHAQKSIAEFLQVEESSGTLVPMGLYNGECKKCCVELRPSFQTGNLTGSPKKIADLRVSVRQWERYSATSGALCERSVVLRPFTGPLDSMENFVGKESGPKHRDDGTIPICVSLLDVSWESYPSNSDKLFVFHSSESSDKEENHEQVLNLQFCFQEHPDIIGVTIEFEVVGWEKSVCAFSSSMSSSKDANDTTRTSLANQLESGELAVHRRRCCLKIPMFSVGGLSAKIATVETGLQREPHLPCIEKKTMCAALQQLVATKSSFTLKALDVNPTVVLVVENTTRNPGNLLPVTPDASLITIDQKFSCSSHNDIHIPANSTRNILLSVDQVKSILGPGHASSSGRVLEANACLAWRMPSVQRCGLLGKVPVAEPACAPSPPISLQIQVVNPEGEACDIENQTCGSSTPAEVLIDYTGDDSDEKEVYEIAVVSINSPLFLDGVSISVYRNVEASPCCPVVVSGFATKCFHSSQLPLKHAVKLWFTSPGLAKVFALIRREHSNEWFVSLPLIVQVSEAA